MVSMQPYSERYDFSFKYLPNLCKKTIQPKFDPTTIYGILKSNPRFSRTCALIERADLAEYLTKDFYGQGYTLFVTEDKNIPDSFMNTMDHFTSRKFINSYLLQGIADVEYFKSNGSSVYDTKTSENPILMIVVPNQPIFVNQVGRLTFSIPASNGIIHMLDNIAQVSYDT